MDASASPGQGHGQGPEQRPDQGRRGDLEFGTTVRLIELSAARFGSREALVDEGFRLSFAELPEAVLRMARGLLALDVRPGERVAVWAPNCWEWVVAALAIHSVGGVLVPINTRFKGDEASYILRKSGVRCLLTVTEFLDIDYLGLLSRAAAPPQLAATVILRGRGQAPAGTHSLTELHHLGERVPAAEARRRAAAVRPEDASDLLFTSGTTGQPKGVLCSHAQTLRAFADWSQRVGLCPEDRYLVAMPFFHTFGYKAGFLAAFIAGATVLPHAVFDVQVILSRIERDRISVLPGPPALYQSLLCQPDLDKRDLSSLRLAVTGAAMIPVDLVERMHRVLRFQTVLTGYGLTEATGVSTLCGPEDDAATVATTSGRAIPGVEVRVAGEDGQPLPAGQPGEVLVRGYTVMAGYWQDESETAAVLNAEGFLHTGDIGVLTERGYLRITDRKKDIFIVGGFNVYPAEVENVILLHPDVAQVAVIGVPDERLGEVGTAFVVLRSGAAPNAAALHEHCRTRLANFKVPRSFEFLPELPRNASGKVLKTELRQASLRNAARG